jgi:hypothetical protein
MQELEHSAVEPSSFSVALFPRGVDTPSKANVMGVDDRCAAEPCLAAASLKAWNFSYTRMPKVAPGAAGSCSRVQFEALDSNLAIASPVRRNAVRVATESDARSLAHLSG